MVGAARIIPGALRGESTDEYRSGIDHHFRQILRIIAGQDQVLRRVGEVLKSHVYDTDFVARYGAEEKLFSLATQLEEARPWRGRLPC